MLIESQPPSTKRAPTNAGTAHTVMIGGKGSGRKLPTYALAAFIMLILGAGIWYGIGWFFGGGDTVAFTEGDDAPENAEASAGTVSIEEAEAECAQLKHGDGQPQRKWYCESMLPMIRAAEKDHRRIDQLEEMNDVQERRIIVLEAQDGKLPLLAWLVIGLFGLLTAFNTVKVWSLKRQT